MSFQLSLTLRCKLTSLPGTVKTASGSFYLQIIFLTFAIQNLYEIFIFFYLTFSDIYVRMIYRYLKLAIPTNVRRKIKWTSEKLSQA